MTTAPTSTPGRDFGTIAATICSGAMIAHQVGGKATRDALFLSNYDVTKLPAMIVAAALLSIVVVLVTSRLMSRFGPARVVPLAFAISAALTIAEWGVIFKSRPVAAVMIYLHIASFGAVLISGFWSVVSEHFDPHTAKKKISRIAGAGTLGGLIGGIIAERMAVRFDIAMILPLLAVGHLLCAWFVRAIPPLPGLATRRRALQEEADEGGASPEVGAGAGHEEGAGAATGAGIGAGPGASHKRRRSGLWLLAEVSYLRNLAFLILLGTVGVTLIDYVFKARATAMFGGSGPELMRFFAAFYTAISLITFLVQTGLGRRLLERLGLSRAVASVPLSVALGGVGTILVPGLISAGIVRGLESVLRNSIFRSGYELFFTPIATRDKRATKSIIDVGFDRLGDAVGGGLVSLMLFIGPVAVHSWLMALAIVVGLAGLLLSRRLHQGYIQALEDSLITQGMHLRSDEINDSLTRMTVMRTMAALQLSQIRRMPIQEALAAAAAEGRNAELRAAPGMDSAAELAQTIATRMAGTEATARAAGLARTARAAGAVGAGAGGVRPGQVLVPSAEDGDDAGGERGKGVDAPTQATAGGRTGPDAPAADPYLQRIADLRSGDPERIRRVLADRENLTPDLSHHTVPLLAWDAVSQDVIMALREIAPRIVGQLLDAMLDPDEEFAIRRRIPRVLSVCSSQRSVDGLLKGLQDRRFEVRFQCGGALNRIRKRSPDVVINRQAVLDAVLREATVSRRVWESQNVLDQLDDQDAPPFADEVLRDRTNRSLEHVFTILSLTLPTEPLRIAYSGLHTDDPGLRGTALEYLESVLPVEIRERLWPLLEDKGAPVRKVRSSEDVLAELLQSHQSIEMNLAALRARRAAPDAGGGGDAGSAGSAGSARKRDAGKGPR